MNQEPDQQLMDEEQTLELFQRYQTALKAGLSIDATDAADQILNMAMEWCESHPPKNWDLMVEASNCELRGDWQGAKVAYQMILERVSDFPADQYFAHRNLAAVYGLLNNEPKELHHYHLATEAARRDETTIIPAMALCHYAAALLRFRRFDEAQSMVDEVCIRLEREEDSQFDQMRSLGFILRADCRLNAGQDLDAEEDLQTAFELIEPISHVETAAGVQADLAYWWSVVGKLRTARNDSSGAVQAWQRAVEIRRSVNSQPHCADAYTAAALSRTLQGLADTYLLAGNSSAAQRLRLESREILSALGLSARK